jgi:HAD superfamily hydrolase (TIGR01509 family)
VIPASSRGRPLIVAGAPCTVGSSSCRCHEPWTAGREAKRLRPVPTGIEIEAVVFDWDGTLMDSRATVVASYREATEDVLGRPFPVEPADIDEIIQLRGRDAFMLIAEGDEELAGRIAAAFHRAYRRHQHLVEPFEGALETIRTIRARGIPIGIATSKSRARMVIDDEHSGISEHVAVSVTGDEVTFAKPDSEAVTAAIAALGTSAARTLYVGDGPNDVIAGRGAGAITVGVSYGFHPREMRESGPDHVIDHPSELLALIGGGREG